MRRLIFLFLIGFLASGCSWKLSGGGAKKWPFGRFHHVEAYLFNLDGRSHPDIIVENALNPSAVHGGRRLSRSESRKLVRILHAFHGDRIMSRCYTPHHGFVFYERDEKAVAYVSACFYCEGIRFYSLYGPPAGYLPDDDLLDEKERARVAGLLQELELFTGQTLSLPVFHSLKEYYDYRESLEK
jgi:hypothetical protein